MILLISIVYAMHVLGCAWIYTGSLEAAYTNHGWYN